jgi:hypothetical protein
VICRAPQSEATIPITDLSPEEKDRRERELRDEARKLRLEGKSREAKKRLDRANNISRKPSRRADHH